MTATELLHQLRAARIEVRVEGDVLLCRPRSAITDELRQQIAANKADLLPLLARPPAPAAVTCPGCGRMDYMPLGRGWRRCWACGRRWGPTSAPDPGNPPDLVVIAGLLGLDRRRRGVPRR